MARSSLQVATDSDQRRLVAALRDSQTFLQESGIGGDLAARYLWAAISCIVVETTPRAFAPPEWAGAMDSQLLNELTQRLRAAVDSQELPCEVLGAAFEERLAEVPHKSANRRDSGAYFTPPAVAQFIVERTLGPILSSARTPEDVLSLRVCDPAAGAGAFVIPALRMISERLAELSGGSLDPVSARRPVLERCVYAVDADSVAILLLRSLLYREVGDPQLDLSALQAHVCPGDSVLGPGFSDDNGNAAHTGSIGLDWRCAFPEVSVAGGFHAVIGNPPWGAIKPAIREYYAALDPSVGQLQGAALREYIRLEHAATASKWELHTAHSREYARRLRDTGHYVHQGPGDTEFYRYFLERAHHLLGPSGRLGFVVPSAYQRAEGAAPLRRLFFEGGTFEFMLDILNTERVFPIHGMFRFLLLVWQRGHRRGIKRAAFGLTSLKDAQRAVVEKTSLSMPLAYIRRVSGARLSIPDLRSSREASIFAALHDIHPVLGDTVPGAWHLRFMRELDMTNDSHLFIDVIQANAEGARQLANGTWRHPRRGVLLPLYEGRMVHQFDSSAKRYLSGQGRSAHWETLRPVEKGVYPHYLVPVDAITRLKAAASPRAAFCDISGHANERTVLAALIPKNAVCGNKVPTCRFDRHDDQLHLLWLALANSFIVDWLARRRVSTTVNFFQWKQLPFPRLEPSTPTGKELIAHARKLSVSPFRAWPPHSLQQRAELRARIDAAVADLYDISLGDLAFILRDFPLLDRHQARIPGRHSTVTRDLVLQVLAARRGVTAVTLRDLDLPVDGGPVDLAERVTDARTRGEVAYVPSEMAESRLAIGV
jgi:hypothetical protein